MSNRTIAGLLCLVVGTGSLSAQKPVAGPAATPDARIDALFADYDKPTSPGCAVAAYQGDRIVYSRAYGMANLDHDVRLTPGSVFHVASVSKQFTAAAILLLAQDGKLSVDDDVRKYLPELPDFGQKITIRHLATHTSGMRDQWALLGLAGWRYSRDLITDDDVLRLLARQKELNFVPGEQHLYSNSGYTLLATIVSRVSGQSFREFTTDRIFKPLGMVNTHFRDNFAEIVKNQAYGYAPEAGSFRLSVTNFDTAGATSLLTTVEDLAKWHANFDQRTIGGERLIAGLLERGLLNDGRRIDYAFGIAHGTYRGTPTIGHGGADAGYRANFVRFPNQRFSVACLCNVSTANPGLLSQRVADIFLEGQLATAPTADDAREVLLSESELLEYAGLYWSNAQASARRFALADGRLHTVFGTNRTPLKSLGGGLFVTTSVPANQVKFVRSPDGTILLNAGPDLTDVYTRAEPFTPSKAQLEEFVGVYRSDEMDAVFRVVASEGGLRLEMLKQRPQSLEPVITDTFVSTLIGMVRFVRNPAGRVTGFVHDAGRIRHMKFWKESSPLKPATSASVPN